MKKFTSFTAIFMMAMMAFTFTSCTDDDDIADTLWGVWEGDMHVWSEWNGQYYEAHESVIQFDRDPDYYATGTGYWVDYYSGAPWDYFASHITWSVENGNIRIYSYEDDTNYYIFDYSLSNNYFTGTIESEWGDPMNFRLVKTVAPNWNDFEWGWDSWDDYYDPWYSSKGTRNGDNEKTRPTRHTGAKPDTNK